MRSFAINSIRVLCFAVLFVVTVVRGDDWPQFRGPTGLGYSTQTKLPIQWGHPDNENVLWKSPLVGEGHASPIVSGERVFVCTVRWPEGVQDRKTVIPEHHVLCYSVADGKLRLALTEKGQKVLLLSE